MVRLCPLCGEPFDSVTYKKYCGPVCTKLAKKGAPKNDGRSLAPTDKFKPFVEAQAEARAKGRELSYGQYQAMQAAAAEPKTRQRKGGKKK